MSFDPTPATIYRVVVNHEEQYSIWPVGKPVPLGWNGAGPDGTKEECLAYIKQVWTDMRPLSLRRQMDGAGERPGVRRAEGPAHRPADLPMTAADRKPSRRKTIGASAARKAPAGAHAAASKTKGRKVTERSRPKAKGKKAKGEGARAGKRRK